jgi:predicted permease
VYNGGLCEFEAPVYMITHDLRYAARVLRKEMPVTIAIIVILAFGIGASTLVFSLANGLLLRPLPYGEPNRIVAVEEDSLRDPNELRQISFLNYLDLRARTRLLEDIGVYTGGAVSIRGEGPAERAPGVYVSDGVFSVLHVEPVLGRVFTRAEDLPHGPRVVVLGEELWQRRYGRDPNVIGKTLEINDSRRTIIGVMPATFHFPIRAELWLPLQMDPAESARTDYYLRGIGRLKPGVSVSAASAELESLLEQIHRENPDVNNGWIARARPYHDLVAGSYRIAVITLLAAVGLLLLIACANVSNLLLSKASARVKEMAVRTALGATRGRLIRQLFSESLLLGVTGSILGCWLALIGMPALLSLVPIDLPRWMDFSIDHRVLGFAVGICLLTILIFGIAPALGSSKTDMTSILKGGVGSSSKRQTRLRHSLVVGEVALSVTLLVGAGLVIRSFVGLRSQNLGFSPERILTLAIDYPASRYPQGPAARLLVQRLLQEISAVPGVSSAVFTTGVPMDDIGGQIFTIEGHPVALKDMPIVQHIVTTPGYFRTLGISLLQGRDFTETDYDTPHIVIVSASFAEKYWPNENALGKRIRFGPPADKEPWDEVVGVVADHKHGPLNGPGGSTVYVPYEWVPQSVLIRTSADPKQFAHAVKARIARFDKDIAISQSETLNQILDRTTWQDRLLTLILAFFAALALVLAGIGLYAIISYTVSLRTHEIGIRMTLGASVSNVRGLIMGQGMTLASLGLMIGILAALALTRLLKTQLYETTLLDPTTYVAVPIVLILISAMAAFLPARRATRVDPVVTLRHE